jgi:uncharacterized repeat protein (TIGR02543 family)
LNRPGYSFAGWNTSQDGSGDTYTNTTVYESTDNITLYAQWSSTTGSNNIVTIPLQIYPNPAKEIITINGIQDGETITIIDLSGHIVIQVLPVTSQQTVNISELLQGEYLIQVGDKTAKFVKK